MPLDGSRVLRLLEKLLGELIFLGFVERLLASFGAGPREVAWNEKGLLGAAHAGRIIYAHFGGLLMAAFELIPDTDSYN